MMRDTRWSEIEEVVLLAMCKAHDSEQAAQMGEPSPWSNGAANDKEFVSERLWAMSEAFEIAKAFLTP